MLAPDINALFATPLSFDDMMQLQGDMLRNMDGRTTQRIHLKDTIVFIKQHRGVGILEIVKNWLQLKKPVISARNEKEALQRLKMVGVPVPTVLAYGEMGRNPATMQSYIMLEAIEPSISLETLTQHWAKQPPSFIFKKRLIETVANMTARMHQAGINHRDLYICHFLLKQDKTTTQDDLPLYLIDLHRAQIRDTVPMRWLIKDLAGLYFSSINIGLTKRDRLRFMKWYSNKNLRDTLKQDAFMWHNTYLRGEQLHRDHS